MQKYTEHKLDITADDRIFTPRGVGALNIGVVQCLSELIANSLDWRRFNTREMDAIRQDSKRNSEGKERFLEQYGHLLDSGPIDTVIKVQYNGDSIEILDNGIGMTLDDLQIGLKLRAASDERREPLRSRKGMFGMGMKVGILGMGWRFAIRTRSLLEKTENCIEIDTRQIEKGQLKLREIIGKVYEQHDETGPLGDLESGTHIRIEDLHKRNHRPAIWRAELGRNFTPEIQYDGIQISIVDNSEEEEQRLDPCQPETIEILPETKIDLDSLDLKVAPDLGDGTRGRPVKIRGWLALRKVSAAGTGRWGLHTFRKGQLVEAFHNAYNQDGGLMPKRPHPNFARVHGEVHLDMCDPNFTKVGWNTELESWSDARDVLAPYLLPLMEASAEYRVKLGGGAKSRKFIQKAKEMAKDAVSKLSEAAGTNDEQPLPEESRACISVGDGEYLKISVAQQQALSGNRFWQYSYRKESHEIAVVVNTGSSLWEWAKDSKDPDKSAALIENWAIVDSLYFCLVDDMDIEPSRALALRDGWHLKLYEVKNE